MKEAKVEILTPSKKYIQWVTFLRLDNGIRKNSYKAKRIILKKGQLRIKKDKLNA